MPHQDDPTITGDLLLYRRIPYKGGRVAWENGIPEPASYNFSDPNNELSLHAADQTTPEALLAGDEHIGFGLVSFTADEVRRACPGLIICRDENDPGHVLVCGKIKGSMRQKIKQAAKWVDGRLPFRDEEDSSQCGTSPTE